MSFSGVNVKVITAPVVEPVTLTETKNHLCINDAYSDDAILGYIQSARELAENYTRATFITQTLELALDEFPPNDIDLPRGPVQSITSVKYIDTSGVEQTLATGNYSLDDYPFVHRVVKGYNVSWPSTRDQRNAVKVRYVVGHGDESTDMDERVKQAHYVAVGHWLKYKADMDNGVGPSRMPRQFYDLLDGYRLVSF